MISDRRTGESAEWLLVVLPRNVKAKTPAMARVPRLRALIGVNVTPVGVHLRVVMNGSVSAIRFPKRSKMFLRWTSSGYLTRLSHIIDTLGVSGDVTEHFGE